MEETVLGEIYRGEGVVSFALLRRVRGGVWVVVGAVTRRKKSFVCSCGSSVPCVAVTCEIPAFGVSSGDLRLLLADSRKWVSSNSSVPRAPRPRNLESPARAPLPLSRLRSPPPHLECSKRQAPPPKLSAGEMVKAPVLKPQASQVMGQFCQLKVSGAAADATTRMAARVRSPLHFRFWF